MKGFRRTIAILLACIMLICDGGLTALAESLLTLPAALQIIDEEAFYGSTSIGKVVLPEGTKEINARAFAGSTLSEINLPDSLTYIADDAFDGPDKVTVTVNPGTYAYDWALRNGYISEELEAVDFSISPDMLILTVGSTYTLSTAFVPSDATTVSVTWGSSKKAVATVSNGTITAKAEGMAIITAIAENGLTATCEVTVVRSIPTPVIISSEQDGMGTVSLTWDGLGIGYEYLVYESIENALVLLGSTTETTYITHAASSGIHKYCIQACIQNENDILVSSPESTIYDVDVQFIWNFAASVEKVEQMSNNSVHITWRGVSPASYYEIAEVVGDNYEVTVSNLTGDETIIDSLTTGLHRFAIRAIYNGDDGATWVSSWSAIKAVDLVEESVISPPAPQLIFEEGEKAFSERETTADVFSPDRFQLRWAHVENANEYVIRLYVKDGNNWVNMLDDTTKDNTYALYETLFDEVDDEQVYRLDIASVNLFEGEPHSYYFIIKKEIVDDGITINGSSNIIWNQASKNASSRVFEIESELAWIAVEDVDWLTVSQDEQQLTVFVDEYDTDIVFADVRTATITVSNSMNEATITVTQADSSYASLETPELSQDPKNPTTISTGGIRFHHSDGGNDLVFVLYEKVGNNYTEIYRKDQVKNNYTTISKNEAGIDFQDNTEYKIELLSVFSRDTYKLYEVDDDILRSEYYFVTKAESSFVTVNGSESYDLLLDENSKSVRVAASGIYSWESDADWLTFSTSRVESTGTYGSLSIVSSDNYSESERIGHVTIRSGSASATINVTQISMLPKLIFPEGISENENSPTSLPYGYFRYETGCVTEKWFKYENNSYTEVEGLGGTSSSFSTVSDYIDTEDNIEAGAKYKIVLTSGEYEKEYFVKFGTSKKTNSVKIDGSEKTSSWTIASTAYTRSITVQGGTSWTATSSASWLKIAKTSGSTSQITTNISALANTTGTDRTATITFKCSGINVNYISVTQKSSDDIKVYYGSNGEYPITETDTAHLSGETDFYNIRVYSSANWSISSNTDWIGFDGSSFKKSSSSLDDISASASVKIWLSENANGNNSRSGIVTVTSGNSSYSFTVSQEPNLVEPVLNSPTLSDDYKNPSIYQFNDGDMILNWKAVQGAKYYTVSCTAEVNGKFIENEVRVTATGLSNYSTTIPQKWLHPEAEDYHYIIITAYDDYDHYESSQYSFYVQNGDAVYLNGKNEPTWNNVTDLEVSNSYLVTSTASWSAQSKANWITVSPQTGSNGDTLSVQLTQNTGSARTGIVTISSGASSINLIVSQCATIPTFPELISPDYSTDKSSPTIIPANTTSITAKWNNEPQATQYTISLLEYSPTSAGRYVEQSGSLTKGESQYTFSNLSLIEGQLYWIRIMRTNNKKNTATSYYFIAGASNSYVTLDKETNINYVDDARGGGTCYKIESSGVWTAVSDTSWLTVGKKYVDEDYLTKNSDNAEDHLEHYGQNGDTLYVYMFPNTTGSTRTGTVTVKSGTASATITFTQEKQYTVAAINSPVLAEHPSEAAEVSYGSLTLNWSSSNSGTGKYEVLLYESDSRNSGYSRVFRKQDITSHSLTIPQSAFTEGKYYKLWLGSEIEDGDDYENGHYYYFIMSYQNALSVSADVDWSQVDNGGYVNISASASGGTGNYYYAYHLLLDGVVEQQTTWETLKYYQFKPWSNGIYQVKVIVKDSAEKQTSYISNYTKNDENTISVATANHYIATIDSNYQFLDYYVLSQRSWNVTSYPDWITPSVTSASFSGDIRLFAEKNDGVTRIGKVIFQNNNGIISDLTVTQNGSKQVAFTKNEGSYISDEQVIDLSFATTGNWNATCDSTWAKLKAKRGDKNTQSISVELEENSSTDMRTAIISILCDGDVDQYTIYQLGKEVESDDINLSILSWQLRSNAAEYKNVQIKTNGSWSIVQLPEWITSNIDSGVNDGDIEFSCSTNDDENARNGTILISSGSASQSINVFQPGSSIYASVSDFTMSTETVDAGDLVTFVVYTENADQVQLIVDDVAYDIYDVTNEATTIVRSFSMGGERKISFLPIRQNKNGLISGIKYLTVNTNGALEKPQLSVSPENAYIGTSTDLTIRKVAHADGYIVRIYAPNSTLIIDAFEIGENELAENNRKIVLNKDSLLMVGEYSVNVIAIGKGYSQSENGITFIRNARDYSIVITEPNSEAEYIPGDTIYASVSQTGGGYASLKVIFPNGEETWYPEEGNHTTNSNNYTAYIPVSESGIYRIFGYIYAVDLPVSQNVAIKETSVTVKSNGPEISRVSISNYGKSYTWIYQSADTKVYITTNNAVDTVSITDTETGAMNTTDAFSVDGWSRIFALQLPNNLDGKHTLSIVATDKALNKSTEATTSLYVVAPIDNYTVYPLTDAVITSSPISGTNIATVQGGSYFEPLLVTHKAGDWLRVRKYDENEGFIQMSLISDKAPSGATGTIEIISPANNDSLQKNSDKYITVNWKSGTPVNIQSAPIAILTNLNTGTSYTLNGQGLFSSRFSTANVPDGQYSLYLQIANASGTIIKSKSIEFVLGGYSDEAYYKEWFEKNIYTWYSDYLTTMGLSSIKEPGMKAVVEANDFIVGGYVSDGNHWWKVLNNEELSSWITMSSTEKKQLNLTLVSNLVLEDETKANSILKADMSNVSNVVATRQNNKVVTAKWNTIFSALDAGWSATQTAMKTAAFTQTITTGISTEISTAFSDTAESWGERVIEMLKDLMMETIADYNTEALIEAYKIEYAKAMKKACKEYVDYLEITLFGGIGESSKVKTSNLDSRQEAALTYIKAYKQYMSNPTQMQEDAVATLLTYCDSNITLDQIRRDGYTLDEAIKAKFSDPDTYGMLLERMTDYLIDDLVKLLFEKIKPNLAVKEFTGIVKGWLTKIIKWDKTNHKFAPDIAGAKSQIESDAKKYGFSLSFGLFLDILGQVNVNKINYWEDMETYIDNGLEVPDSVTADHKRVKNGIVKSALDLCKSAWKTGNKIAGLIEDSVELNSQSKGRAMFEMYGAYMAGAYKYRVTYTSGAMVLNFNWDYLSKLTISELEQKRAGLITLMNNDIDALIYYRNMMQVNENANWKFHLVLRDANGKEIDRYDKNDYTSYTQIDAEIKWINAEKKWIVNVPSDIQKIINKYQ